MGERSEVSWPVLAILVAVAENSLAELGANVVEEHIPEEDVVEAGIGDIAFVDTGKGVVDILNTLEVGHNPVAILAVGQMAVEADQVPDSQVVEGIE